MRNRCGQVKAVVLCRITPSCTKPICRTGLSSCISILHDRMDKEKKAWPGLNTIAKDLSLSRSTVKRAVKDLEKAGLIRKEPHYRENGSATSNRYYLL